MNPPPMFYKEDQTAYQNLHHTGKEIPSNLANRFRSNIHHPYGNPSHIPHHEDLPEKHHMRNMDILSQTLLQAIDPFRYSRVLSNWFWKAQNQYRDSTNYNSYLYPLLGVFYWMEDRL